MNILKDGILQGRRIKWFHHKSSASWGYKKQQTDTFAVLHPKNEAVLKKYPLYVVFHSSGHSVYSAVSCIENKGDHDIYHVPDEMYGLFVDCYENRENDWWWGGINPNEKCDISRYGIDLQPVEKRVLDTVNYIINNFPIDKNRVYAAGNSMGGSGALGIALNHGNIFASVIANVPAGVEHAIERCGLNANGDSPVIPDPPVVVDYSAQNDVWSVGHEKFYSAMKQKKYAVIGYFGPFGHENNYSKILEINDLVLCYNPLELRLDEAYPVFTDASTDDDLPWPSNLLSNASGQINAFFMWKNITDSKSIFRISIKLLENDDWQTKRELPKKAETSVSFRRIQNFEIHPKEKIIYTYADQSGIASADENGLITIKITVTNKNEILSLKKI